MDSTFQSWHFYVGQKSKMATTVGQSLTLDHVG